MDCDVIFTTPFSSWCALPHSCRYPLWFTFGWVIGTDSRWNHVDDQLLPHRAAVHLVAALIPLTPSSSAQGYVAVHVCSEESSNEAGRWFGAFTPPLMKAFIWGSASAGPLKWVREPSLSELMKKRIDLTFWCFNISSVPLGSFSLALQLFSFSFSC